jgi:hypothetical protein
MRSPLVWGLALSVAALAIAPGLRAEELPQPDAGQVRALVRQLDDQRFPVRQEADRQLRELGIGVVPLLRQELARRPALEIYRRLEAIVDELAQIKWRHDPKEALKEAKRTGKPLLVLSSLGRSDGSGSLATQAMVNRSLGDLPLIHFVSQHFIPVWHQQLDDANLDNELQPRLEGIDPNYSPEQVRQYEEGRGRSNLRTFFCTPEGKVFHRLEGFASANSYLSQVKDARQLLRGTAGLPAAQRAALLRITLTQRGEEVTRGRQGLEGHEAVQADLDARLLLDSASKLDQPIEPLLAGIRQEFYRMTFS